MVQMAPRAVIMALFLVLVFLIETETGAQFYNQSYALVVGIDKYRSPKWRALTYAVKDAQGMAEFLKQQGFQVTSIYNEMATRNNIVYEMQNVLARRVKKGDRVLVFFLRDIATQNGTMTLIMAILFLTMRQILAIPISPWRSFRRCHARWVKPSINCSLWMRAMGAY